MSRLLCKCGETMWNGLTPNDINVWCYTDRRLDEILAEDSISTLELANLWNYEVWVCPCCKRLYVFENSERNKVKYVYALERDETQIS